MGTFSLYSAFETLWRNILFKLENYATKKEMTESSIRPITEEEINEICGSSIYAVEEAMF